MTNEEAIEWLRSIDKKYIHGGDEQYDEQRHEAIKTAIKALEDQPKGKWVVHNDYNENCRYGCNQCGSLTNRNSRFCPTCGARMEVSNESNN